MANGNPMLALKRGEAVRTPPDDAGTREGASPSAAEIQLFMRHFCIFNMIRLARPAMFMLH